MGKTIRINEDYRKVSRGEIVCSSWDIGIIMYDPS